MASRNQPAAKPAQDQQLARRRTEGELIPSDPIKTTKALTEALLNMEGVANIVTPVARIDTIPEMHQVSLRVVMVDPTVPKNSRGYPTNGNGPDCYFDSRFCENNERGLGKNAILKILAAAGVQKVDEQDVYTGSARYFWKYKVTLQGEDFDGHIRQVTGTKELDLRDGAPEALRPEKLCSCGKEQGKCEQHDKGSDSWKNFKKTGELTSLSASALAEKRRHGAANCATKALLRAAREFFHLPHKMKLEDLQNPFVVPKLVAQLDPRDPDVKAALIQKALWGDRALYGPGTAPALPSRSTEVAGTLAQVDPDEPIDGEAPPPAPAAEAEVVEPEVLPPQPAAPEPQTPQAKPSDGPLGPEPPPIEGTASATQEPQTPPAEDDDPMPPSCSEPDVPRCKCPCKCGDPISELQQKKSLERLGDERCPACYPDEGFDFKKHEKTENLNLPKFPQATPAQVERWNKRRKSR